MRSAPTLKIWITPLASVAMLEKLALLKMAFCRAPVVSCASWRRNSLRTFAISAPFSEVAFGNFSVMAQPRFNRVRPDVLSCRSGTLCAAAHRTGRRSSMRQVHRKQPQACRGKRGEQYPPRCQKNAGGARIVPGVGVRDDLRQRDCVRGQAHDSDAVRIDWIDADVLGAIHA